MRKSLYTAVAVATILFLGESAVAYWNGPFMAPPPIPRPPSGFTMYPRPAWGVARRTYPATGGQRFAAVGRQAPPAAVQPSRGAAQVAKVVESELSTARRALQTLRAERDRLQDQCAARDSGAGQASAAAPAQGPRPETEKIERLSAELAQVRAELVVSSERIHALMAERDELKAQFGSNMGDVASVRNALEQVRKRAVEVGIALSDSQGTNVGGGLEREFLKADLDRLIAALALADAVLSNAGPGSRASRDSGAAALRTGELQSPTLDAGLIEAASFETDR